MEHLCQPFGEGRSFALLTKDASAYFIAVCHGNVKLFPWLKDEKGVPKQQKAIRGYPRCRQHE